MWSFPGILSTKHEARRCAIKQDQVTNTSCLTLTSQACVEQHAKKLDSFDPQTEDTRNNHVISQQNTVSFTQYLHISLMASFEL